jgi:hypothetical protein
LFSIAEVLGMLIIFVLGLPCALSIKFTKKFERILGSICYFRIR